MSSCQYQQELIGMGFKGANLSKLLTVIVDADTMQELYNFIILKCEGMSNLQIAHKFYNHMRDKQSYASYEQFETAYTGANDVVDRQGVIAKLLATKANTEQLIRVLILISDRRMTLPTLYGYIVRYRKLYTVDQTLILLEAL